MINGSLQDSDFSKEPAYIQEAFLNGKARVVSLKSGMKLFKLSSYTVQEGRNGFLSPWWSAVDPFEEDKLGARGRYLEAKANSVSMREMVRFASAIRIDWNDIEEYQEIALQDGAKAYWGGFAPQPAATKVDSSKFSLDSPMSVKDMNAMVGQMVTNATKRKRLKDMGVYVPDTLGGIEAWQLYIPNLKLADVKVVPSIPSHDMAALGLHFSVI
ncbi:MAG TPA: hypothetical protein VGU61_05090 [Noviherbaspirillum sp.]|jgi:hypothetical protein|uniref:hypothetical protein n=1 Tax=Noviherbaspirillum sp. TaxID=1926288 RepID=UPI002DDD8476|nr:hypothetical protein [Noviherbaspirillum sp.]HEV2609623.1 hypothetical protein [Noviherbaspirillum sp.]